MKAVQDRPHNYDAWDVNNYYTEKSWEITEPQEMKLVEEHLDDVIAAENKLDFAEGNLTYLSRADGFANFEEAVKRPESYELDGEVQGNGTYNPEDYNNPDDEMPVTGANNGMELYELRGAAHVSTALYENFTRTLQNPDNGFDEYLIK